MSENNTVFFAAVHFYLSDLCFHIVYPGRKFFRALEPLKNSVAFQKDISILKSIWFRQELCPETFNRTMESTCVRRTVCSP